MRTQRNTLPTRSNVYSLPSQVPYDSFPRVYASRPAGSFESFVLQRSDRCPEKLYLTAEKRDGTGMLETDLLTPAQADDFVKTPIRLRGKAFQELMA